MIDGGFTVDDECGLWRSRGCWHRRRRLDHPVRPSLSALPALPVPRLLTPPLMNGTPRLVPLPAAEATPQCQQGSEMAWCGVHAAALHPGFDDELAGTLDH